MANGKIRISTTTQNAIHKMDDVNTKLASINNKLINLDTQLTDSKWTGYSNNKTQDINRLLKMYCTNIENLVTEMKDNMSRLDTNAIDFESRYNKI